MHFSKVLALIALSAANKGFVEAAPAPAPAPPPPGEVACREDGSTWNDVQQLEEWAHEVCTKEFIRDAWPLGETIAACRDAKHILDNDWSRVNFHIRNDHGSPISINPEDCEDELRRVIHHCHGPFDYKRGGYVTKDGSAVFGVDRKFISPRPIQYFEHLIIYHSWFWKMQQGR